MLQFRGQSILLTITRPVLVKVRITDNYKKNLVLELQQNISKVELELQQIEFQTRKLAELAKKNPAGVESALNQLEQEKHKRLDTRLKLLDKIKEVGKLTNGTEVVQGQVESIIEVNLGDNWSKILSAEIVLEDGKVVEIRSGESEVRK